MPRNKKDVLQTNTAQSGTTIIGFCEFKWFINSCGEGKPNFILAVSESNKSFAISVTILSFSYLNLNPRFSIADETFDSSTSWAPNSCMIDDKAI